jgi:hypothetical protein
MKAAILGTQSMPEQDERALLRSVGIAALQQMAGYVPAQIPPQTLRLFPVEAPYRDCALRLMVQLCDQPIEDCNPRVPYLFLAWLLVGSDNDYRATQYVMNDQIVRRIAAAFISMACGEAPTLEKLEQIRKATVGISSSATIKAARLAVDIAAGQKVEADRITATVAVTAANRIFHSQTHLSRHPHVIIEGLQQRAAAWCTISDNEIIDILYSMVWDIYGNSVSDK